MKNKFNDLSLLDSCPLLPVYKQLLDSMNNHDAEAFSSMFLENGVVILSDNIPLIGRKMIYKNIKDIYEIHNKAVYSARVTTLKHLSLETKLVISEINAISVPLTEGTSNIYKVSQVLTFILQEGEWKIGLLCNNNIKKEEIIASKNKLFNLGLSEKEEQVLDLIIKGYTNEEIAEKCNMKPRTVSTHRSNILKKTGHSNIFALTIKINS